LAFAAAGSSCGTYSSVLVRAIDEVLWSCGKSAVKNIYVKNNCSSVINPAFKRI